jgi:hypothetical protein
MRGKDRGVGNGVDSEYFSPEHDLPSPYPAGEIPIVFTGAMDYWPNVDAVSWFASEMLPQLSSRRPGVKFYIVGMRPAPSVQRLTGAAVTVTGTVPDVRPYLQACGGGRRAAARGARRAEQGPRSHVDGAPGGRLDRVRQRHRRDADRDYAAASDADAFVASIGACWTNRLAPQRWARLRARGFWRATAGRPIFRGSTRISNLPLRGMPMRPDRIVGDPRRRNALTRHGGANAAATHVRP